MCHRQCEQQGGQPEGAEENPPDRLVVNSDHRPPVGVQAGVSGNGQTVGKAHVVLKYSNREASILNIQYQETVKTDPPDPPIARHPQRAAHEQQKPQDDPESFHGIIVPGRNGLNEPRP